MYKNFKTETYEISVGFNEDFFEVQKIQTELNTSI